VRGVPPPSGGFPHPSCLIIQMILKGRLNGKQRNRLKRLFDMMYTPAELAEEIGIDKNQIYRVYLPLGCPHERDERRHYWINGKEFLDWYRETYKSISLGAGEAYCRTCNKAVKMVSAEEHKKDDLVYSLGNCANCNRKLVRIITRDKSKQLEAD